MSVSCLLCCPQVSGALRGIGDNDLAGRFDDACTRIKRDIIFAASLYL
jgi:superfamily II RNA helicase